MAALPARARAVVVADVAGSALSAFSFLLILWFSNEKAK
jgi:hypothetical protein